MKSTILQYLKLSISIVVAFLSSCNSNDNAVTWQYIIPDGYSGWIAIQYDCPTGKPLNRQGNVITVEFTDSGLFCTTDSFFASRFELITINKSGISIPSVGQPWNENRYVICCGQAIGVHVSEPGQSIDLSLRIEWVGYTTGQYPSLDFNKIDQDALNGNLIPSSW